ncbi:MAG: helix-turn-helix domain-containing protein [Bdellovibrionaceae bacterium]|nr:helix-turn-helix domain-containing protein [Pseudobdellovibrionaceae bacterium]
MATSNLTSDDKKFLVKLGAKIRAIRTKKGWTLEEVEEHGWGNWTHLQKIESGKNITIVTLRKVATLYRMSLSDLLDGV